MSKETLHILLNMNHDTLETQIAMQCAPLLAGMKISNLLTVDSRKRQEVIRTFRNIIISCYVLYDSEEKTTFLLYRRQMLVRYLLQPETEELMERFGYHHQHRMMKHLKTAGRWENLWLGFWINWNNDSKKSPET